MLNNGHTAQWLRIAPYKLRLTALGRTEGPRAQAALAAQSLLIALAAWVAYG
jgi:hypothetical protein